MNIHREAYIKKRDRSLRSKLRTKFILEKWRIEDSIRDLKSKPGKRIHFPKIPKW